MLIQSDVILYHCVDGHSATIIRLQFLILLFYWHFHRKTIT